MTPPIPHKLQVFTPGVIYDADVDTWFLFYGGVGSHYQNHTGLSFSEWQGLASSRSPYGPFAKYANNPIIRSPAGPPTAALADDPLSGCRPCSPMLSTRLTGGRVLAQVHLLAPDFRLCAGACCRESNCSAWSYDGTAGPQGRCVLLAADATQPPLEPVPAAGAVAGFQLTPSPCQPSSEPPQVGINISGEDMGHLLIPRNDSSLCAAACCASGACVAYTFTWSQPNAAENCPKGSNCCWLKSGYAATNPEANVVSGRVTRAAAATCPQLNSTVLRGGRQLQQMALPRADPLLCETACLDLMPCTGFSYTPQQAQATAACPQGSPCCTLQGMQSTPEPQAGTVSRNMFDRFVLWDQTWIRADNPRPIYLDGPSGGSSNSGSSSGSTRNPGPRRVLSMKTVQLDMSALMDHFVPSGPSWFGTYSTLPYNPVVRPTKLDAKGFENQEYFNTPHDPFWHMIGNSHGSAGQPHMVSTDVTGGGNWTIVEVIQNLGEPAPVARGLPSPHQPPPEYFVRFDGNPLSIHLYTIEWRMVPLPQPPCS